jgi:hypothetical protein
VKIAIQSRDMKYIFIIILSAKAFMQKNIDVIMPKNYIKEAEEKDYLDRFVAYLKMQNEDAAIVECPIASSIQKEMKKGDSVPDGIIKRGTEICWVEIVTMSTYDEERKRINQQRNKKITVDDNMIYIINLGWAAESCKEQLGKVLKNKFSKKYSNFAQLKQVTKGILLIGYIYEHPFFDTDHINELLSSFNEKVLYSLGAGNSNFDEIYFCAYVQDVDGSWLFKIVCIVDSDMMKWFREKIV